MPQRPDPRSSALPGARRSAAIVLAILLGLTLASSVRAGLCAVPGSYDDIQQAINDPTCTTINLAAQTYAESIVIRRSLTLAGPGGGGAIVEGQVEVQGSETVVSLDDLMVHNGCSPNALLVLGGAEVSGRNMIVERSAALPCPTSVIFADGFESGGTQVWTVTVP